MHEYQDCFEASAIHGGVCGLLESETPKQAPIIGQGLQTELDLDVDQLLTKSSPALSSASLSELMALAIDFRLSDPQRASQALRFCPQWGDACHTVGDTTIRDAAPDRRCTLRRSRDSSS